MVNTLVQAGAAVGAVAVVLVQLLAALHGRMRLQLAGNAAAQHDPQWRLRWMTVRLLLSFGFAAVVLFLFVPAFVVAFYFLGHLDAFAAAEWLVPTYVVGVMVLTVTVAQLVPGWLD